MSGVMVLRSGRETTIFIESSRLRDRITRVIIIFRRIYEAPHGGDVHKSHWICSSNLTESTTVRLFSFGKVHHRINYTW